MPSRRTLIAGGVVVVAAAGLGALARRRRTPRERPAGIPVGPFGRSSTAEEVVTGLDLAGRTFLVTGATSGLGLESARVIAARGAHVIVTGRTRDKAADAVAALPGRFTPVALELTDFDSAVACAAEVRAAAPSLDAVICNAGVMELPERELVYGLEKQFVTNHLGHFVLVNRLLDRVTAAPQGRIVVVASGQYRNAPEAGIEFDNLDAHRDYAPTRAYGHSKLANGLFVRSLAKRLAATTATANVIVPGVAMTNLGRHQPAKAALGRLIGWTFMKSTQAAASTQVYVATAPALAKVSGQFFADCNPEIPSGHMQDDAMAERLWQVSERITAKWLAG